MTYTEIAKPSTPTHSKVTKYSPQRLLENSAFRLLENGKKRLLEGGTLTYSETDKPTVGVFTKILKPT